MTSVVALVDALAKRAKRAKMCWSLMFIDIGFGRLEENLLIPGREERHTLTAGLSTKDKKKDKKKDKRDKKKEIQPKIFRPHPNPCVPRFQAFGLRSLNAVKTAVGSTLEPSNILAALLPPHHPSGATTPVDFCSDGVRVIVSYFTWVSRRCPRQGAPGETQRQLEGECGGDGHPGLDYGGGYIGDPARSVSARPPPASSYSTSTVHDEYICYL